MNFLGPGPASYQQYEDYNQIGEKYIYARQPYVRIHPLIGSKLKRNINESDLHDKKTNFKDMKPFWTTIGTRTYNSRLPNAPIPTIHHRFNMTRTDTLQFYFESFWKISFILVEMEEKKNKLKGTTMPGPAAYPIINNKIESLGTYACTSRGVTISPRYHVKQLTIVGPGPAMIERELLDKGVRQI